MPAVTHSQFRYCSARSHLIRGQRDIQAWNVGILFNGVEFSVANTPVVDLDRFFAEELYIDKFIAL